MNEPFEPKILCFLCTWWTYAAADLAGVSRMQYPTNIRSIRVMCSGTVSPHHILKAFQKGVDGVFIGGCHIGDCHYLAGNFMTKKRVAFMKELLAFTGLEPERLRVEWISSAEGPEFAKYITEFVQQVRDLGPNPLQTARAA